MLEVIYIRRQNSFKILHTKIVQKSWYKIGEPNFNQNHKDKRTKALQDGSCKKCEKTNEQSLEIFKD